MPGRRKREAALHAAWADGAVSLLTDEFGLDEQVSGLLRQVLGGHTDGMPHPFEFILDDPMSANWRLKHDPRLGRWGLRLSDYRFSSAGRPPCERVERVQAALEQLAHERAGTAPR